MWCHQITGKAPKHWANRKLATVSAPMVRPFPIAPKWWESNSLYRLLKKSFSLSQYFNTDRTWLRQGKKEAKEFAKKRSSRTMYYKRAWIFQVKKESISRKKSQYNNGCFPPLLALHQTKPQSPSLLIGIGAAGSSTEHFFGLVPPIVSSFDIDQLWRGPWICRQL